MSKRKRFLLVSLVTVTFVSVVFVFSPALVLIENYIEAQEQEDEVIRRFCAEYWDEGKHADDPAAMAGCYKSSKDVLGPFQFWTCIGDCPPKETES